MNISRFFIDRPIFAAVLAVFITLIGVFAYPLLPLSQYPEIAPPTITINTAYAGASAETLAETVAAPIEQEVNGVEGMLYITSSSTSDGAVAITVTFQPGTDLDSAQVLVQNRVALAEPRLPAAVRQVGVTVNKAETGFLMILGLTSPGGQLDNDYVGNYATSTLRDRLLRIDGVGTVNVFGGGNYAMRIWIDPAKAAARGLSASQIVAALQAQNVQAAAGSIGQPPFATNSAAFAQPVQVQGRLTDPQ
ncbi:MAG: efflux RND transporter permease subunit, partial [Brevundimonas sp.]